MNRPRERVDLASVVRVTSSNRHHLAHMQRVLTDPDKAARLAQQVCQACAYQGRIGGAACSFRECAFCTKTLSSGNTCVDVLCIPCAQERDLCVRCGGDIHLKTRRKLEKKT